MIEAFKRQRKLKLDLVVDAGVGRGVSHSLEGRACSAGVGGCCHLPGEVNLCLVDPCFLTALLHHGVLWVAGVTGCDAHQRVTWRRRPLTALLGNLLNVIIVGQRDHLMRGNEHLFT